MQEFILIFSCVNNINCSEIILTYGHHNPDKVQYLKDLEQHVNPKIKKYVPMFVCGASLNCSFNISKEITLKTDPSGFRLSYTTVF